jgi:hypothetical protein
MNLAVEVSRRGGKRYRRFPVRPVMQLNSALASRRGVEFGLTSSS